MPIAEIIEVIQAPLESTEFVGFYIDQPQTGASLDCYAIKILGWVLAPQLQRLSVTAMWNGKQLARTNPIDPRPDVASAFPDTPHSGRSGFCMLVSLLGVPMEATITIQAIIKDGPTIELGVIRVRRSPLRRLYQPDIQPLLLTSLGRSGSKWLLMLIAQHPQIVALRPADLEPRPIHYWTNVFREISNPNSYLQILAGDLSNPHYWLGRTLPEFAHEFPNSSTTQWLGRRPIETAAAFCQQQVEAFYQHAAHLAGNTRARYFVEKHVPDSVLSALVSELFPESREIFLVRDLRDVFCSMLAFNAKNQREAFLKEKSTTDEQFIESVRFQASALLEEWKARTDKALLVRYEDLIPRPAATLTGIFEYLGLDAWPQTIEGILDRASAFRFGEHQTASSPDASIRRWQQDLTPKLRAACQEAFGEIMNEFGYSS